VRIAAAGRVPPPAAVRARIRVGASAAAKVPDQGRALDLRAKGRRKALEVTKALGPGRVLGRRRPIAALQCARVKRASVGRKRALNAAGALTSMSISAEGEAIGPEWTVALGSISKPIADGGPADATLMFAATVMAHRPVAALAAKRSCDAISSAWAAKHTCSGARDVPLQAIFSSCAAEIVRR
jgi:hypothetical protein